MPNSLSFAEHPVVSGCVAGTKDERGRARVGWASHSALRPQTAPRTRISAPRYKAAALMKVSGQKGRSFVTTDP